MFAVINWNNMKIQTQLKELLGSHIITQEIADKIVDYYAQKSNGKPNPLLIAFGILGALIGGLGIILILAHNWDSLSVRMKSIIAFLPLLLGQFLCGYSLFKKKGNVVWSESSSLFLFISIGACISLISQVYHISGDFDTFLITWLLLGLPLVYLLRSFSTSLLYIIGITFYGVNQGYFNWNAGETYYFWMLLAGILPFIVWMQKTQKDNNFLKIAYWFIALSLTITLGTIAYKTDILMHIAYFSLFGVMYNFGHSRWMSNHRIISNGPRLIGGLGMTAMLFFYSFNDFWRFFGRYGANIYWGKAILSPELLASTGLILLSVIILCITVKRTSWQSLKPMSFLPFLFVLLFALGYYWSFSQLAINITVLLIGVHSIKIGADKDDLGLLNKGLAIVAILAFCRFFDQNISFVIKGIIFLIVGASFYVANYLLIQKRKKNLNQ